MNKITGYIPAWGCENFIEPALKQALEICDEVIVSVGPYAENLVKYEDSTYDICYKYRDSITLLKSTLAGFHRKAQVDNLREMILKSKLREVGNWVMLLCVDEFYYMDDIVTLKENIFDSDYDGMLNKESQYYINTTKYIASLETAPTLWKITHIDQNWTPTAGWNYQKQKKLYDWTASRGKQHYGFLMDPYFKKELWMTYDSPTLKKNHFGVMWMDKVYLKYDLNNEELGIETNFKLFGHKSPYRTECIVEKDGTLLTYDEKHPKVIEEAGLTKIKDFRKIYTKK